MWSEGMEEVAVKRDPKPDKQLKRDRRTPFYLLDSTGINHSSIKLNDSILHLCDADLHWYSRHLRDDFAP